MAKFNILSYQKVFPFWLIKRNEIKCYTDISIQLQMLYTVAVEVDHKLKAFCINIQ